MKTLEQWLSDYEVSHQNKTNKLIHYFCVPLIVFSVLGLLDTLSSSAFLNLPLSLAYIVIFFSSLFYLRLNIRLGLITIALTVAMVLSLQIIEDPSFQLTIHLSIFTVAWVFQFIGHKIEGKKPSFLQDLAYLLIGPLWVIHQLTKRHS